LAADAVDVVIVVETAAGDVEGTAGSVEGTAGVVEDNVVVVVADTMAEVEVAAGWPVVEGRKVEAVAEAAVVGTIEVAVAGRRRVSGQSRQSVVVVAAAAAVVVVEEEEAGIAVAVDIVAVVEAAGRLVDVAMLQRGQECTDWAEEVCTVLEDCTAVWAV